MGFSIVGIYLKLWAGDEGSPDSLDQNKSEAELRVMNGQSLTQGAKELFVPEGLAGVP